MYNVISSGYISQNKIDRTTRQHSISSKIGCNIHTLHSHECYHYVYTIKTVTSGAIMASDKDHNTPVVLSLKKGKTSQSENSIWNSSIFMVKEKISHYFGLMSVSPFCLLTYYVN